MRITPALVSIAALCTITGCVVPAMRPMRTVPGPSVMVAGGWMDGAADEAFCHDGCDAEPVGNFHLPSADLRYGHMLGPSLGITGGVYLGGPHLAKREGVLSYLLGYGQVSWQNDHASVSASLDLGANVIAPVVGADVQPLGSGRWKPNLAVYARYAQPLRPGEPTPGDPELVAAASWDAGATLRVGLVLVQYSHYRQRDGVAEIPYIIEGATQASAWHVFMVGVDLPLSSQSIYRRSND